jgi:hypothetical protein
MAGANQRSAFPQYNGVPWWGAVLIAVTMTLAGLAVEAGSGHQELGSAFAIAYALGCVAAVLAVRQSGVFTAVIQPPLLLFVAVPLAYYLFHNSSFSGLKEVAITCGYPLIERFPLMLFTTSAVLLIGLVRWYLAMAHPAGDGAAAAGVHRGGLFSGLSTKVSSAFAGNGSVDEEPGQRAARPRHVVDRPGGGKRRKPPPRSQQRSPTRSRRSRPVDESAPPRPRRDRGGRPAEEWESDIPRRRTREPRESRDPRRTPPPPRREPRERREYREAYPPCPARGNRYDETGRGYQSPPAYPPYPAEPRRRPAPNGSSSTHHPVSRARYRGSDPADADHRDEPRRQPRR